MALIVEERAAAEAAEAALRAHRKERRTSILEDDAYVVIAAKINCMTKGSELEELVKKNSSEILCVIQELAEEMVKVVADYNEAVYYIRAGEADRTRLEEDRTRLEEDAGHWKANYDSLLRRSEALLATGSSGSSKSERLPDPEALTGNGTLE